MKRDHAANVSPIWRMVGPFFERWRRRLRRGLSRVDRRRGATLRRRRRASLFPAGGRGMCQMGRLGLLRGSIGPCRPLFSAIAPRRLLTLCSGGRVALFVTPAVRMFVAVAVAVLGGGC